MQIRIFYDGYCPLCLAEMNKLKKYDTAHKISFVDIQQPDFAEHFPDLNWHELDARIHVQKLDGTLVTGLDATYLAWKIVGKGWLYAWLRWPIIGWFADGFYSIFARHRYAISYLLTGKKRCQSCEIPKLVGADTSRSASSKVNNGSAG